MPEKKLGNIKNGEGWAVGVGASAGGLEALGQFVSHLPPGFAGTIIIAQHLAPHSKSMMVELLARQATLPVAQAVDQARLEEGTIYIVPPNHDIDLVEDRILLTVADERTRPKPSVDEFFGSLAKAFGERAVGIILSGTGSDGAQGIRAIKAAGGLTIAQDDRTAKYDGMPRAAVETGCVDTILPPEAIAENLIQTLNDHELRLNGRRINPEHLSAIFEVIHERLGQDFRNYKLSTIQRRIIKRMGAVGINQFDLYLARLKDTPGEVGELAKELLISVTKFFRDPEVFQELRHTLRAAVQRNEVGQEFRIWVAGCATGEEAYTLSILLLELQQDLKRPFSYKIFATDLDHDAIQEARTGIYSADSLAQLREEITARYFQRVSDTSFEVAKRVRDNVVFARQDLIQNPPFVKLDMISCRNVMIYFDTELQKKILEIFHYALLPSGILLLGKSETPLANSHLFEPLDRNLKIFQRLNVPSRAPTQGRITGYPLPDLLPVRKAIPQQSLSDLAYRKIIDHFRLAAVVVDAEANLLQVFGDVSPYIQFFSMQPDLKLPNLLPKNIGIEIPILLRKAGAEKALQKSRTYQALTPSEHAYQISVQPVSDVASRGTEAGPYYLVTFEAVVRADAIAADRDGGRTIAEAPSDMPARMHELEQELFVTREHLQTVIEELGVSNEELQSLNEELSSTNEEMQATNEELETTNEELQSSNEELTTVNDELSAKTNEVRAFAVTLENIQNSIGSPLVVLDDKLRVVRFNSDAQKIFYISGQDVGRDILRISTTCEIPDFQALANRTIRTGSVSECICEANQTVYQLRILPSYDERHALVGVILIFIDNTERIRTSEKLAASETRIRAIIDASPSLISLKDHLGRYLLVNNSFRLFFGIEPDREVAGKTDRDLMKAETATQIRDADLEVFIKREPQRKEDTLLVRDGEKAKTLLSNRFPIMDQGGRGPVGVGTIAIDITAQKEVQQALAQSESLYRAIAEDQTVLVCRYDRAGKISYANAAFAHYFSVRAEEAVGKNFFAFALPMDSEVPAQSVAAISSYHPVSQHENRVLRWHSELRWLRWINRGIFNPQGELTECQSVGFDVTDYRVQTEQLKRKEAVFGRIFENISDYISIFHYDSGQLRLESLNPSAERELGYTFTQFVGRKLNELLDDSQAKQMETRYRQVIESRKAASFEEEVNLAGRARHFMTTIVPIPNDSGEIDRIAALSRDVSNYKAIEYDLRQAKEAAEVANHTKSDFLASMSHELRTPLNVVLGFCQMLELGRLDDEQTGYVAGIHRAGRLLLGLIEDILDISKIEAGKIKLETISFHLEDVARDAIDLFALQANEKGLQLRLTSSPSARKFVAGDPSRLRQVIVNFISNAIKFTTRGEIEVKVEGVAAETPGDWRFKLSVRDSGIGIRDEYKSRIFKKFSQAETGHSRRFGGTGLGLAISKELIGLMGGEIGFESEAGQGSTFWFEVSLPLTTRKTQLNRTTRLELPPSKNPQPARHLRILAIDDNFDSRTVIGLFLKKLGHSFELADGGASALNLIRDKEFDLVLMDIQMPGMDGYETTRNIRGQAAHEMLPVIALTANALKEDIERCYAAGMDDYVSKPVKIEDLNAVLDRWAEKLAIQGALDQTANSDA